MLQILDCVISFHAFHGLVEGVYIRLGLSDIHMSHNNTSQLLGMAKPAVFSGSQLSFSK